MKEMGKLNQVGKHTSGYQPGELPQPRQTGQYSNSGNPENPNVILHEKIDPKTHDHQIIQGRNESKSVSLSREKARSLVERRPSD